MQEPLFSSATPVTPVDGPAVTVAQTPADELLVRMATRLNPNYPRVPAYVQQVMLADMRALYGEVVGTPNPVALGTYVAREPLVAYGHSDLQYLKDRLLAPREIVREEGGYLYHPELPILDESVRIDEFLRAFGIECEFVSMETDCPNDPRVDEYFEAELDCSWWNPTPPDGAGWQLAEIYDTENGVYAMFLRSTPQPVKISRRRRVAVPTEGHCLCQEDIGHPIGTCQWVDGKRPCESNPGQTAG